MYRNIENIKVRDIVKDETRNHPLIPLKAIEATK